MKRWISLLLCLLLALPAFGLAEEAPTDAMMTTWLKKALRGTADMVANAIETDADGGTNQWLQRFTRTAYMTPLRAVVIPLSRELRDTLAEGLQADAAELVRAFGRRVNASFDEAYADAADRVLAQEETKLFNDEESALVLLVYEWELSLTYVQGDRPYYQSVFLIGMPSLAKDIDEAYVQSFAASLGIEDVQATMYPSAESIRALWGENVDIFVTEALRRSEKTLEGMTREALPTFSYDLPDTVTPLTLAPTDTVLAVQAAQRPDEEKEYQYPLLLESAFPAQRIPASPEKATYLLLIDTHWEKQLVSNDVTLHEAYTQITLHEAAPGRQVMNLGQQKDSYSGAVLVSNKMAYKSVDIDRILTTILTTLFP